MFQHMLADYLSGKWSAEYVGALTENHLSTRAVLFFFKSQNQVTKNNFPG